MTSCEHPKRIICWATTSCETSPKATAFFNCILDADELETQGYGVKVHARAFPGNEKKQDDVYGHSLIDSLSHPCSLGWPSRVGYPVPLHTIEDASVSLSLCRNVFPISYWFDVGRCSTLLHSKSPACIISSRKGICWKRYTDIDRLGEQFGRIGDKQQRD
jgi:hypothetical protein